MAIRTTNISVVSGTTFSEQWGSKWANLTFNWVAIK